MQLTGSELRVARALAEQMGAGDRLLQNVRISDPQHGDVEIDAVLLLAGDGIAIIEVKGNGATFEDGEWRLPTRGSNRRIDPIGQARRGKHALRRFIDRQSTWRHGLPRCEWFVALPMSKIVGDIGPEGRRELIIDSNDLPSAVERIRRELRSAAPNEHRLSPAEVHEIAALLSGAGADEILPASLFRRALNFAAPLPIAMVIGILTESLGQRWTVNLMAAVAMTFTALVLRGEIVRRIGQAMFLGIAVGLSAMLTSYVVTLMQAPACNANYSKCVPIRAQVSCDDVLTAVRVTGTDVYNLDRDNDGRACEPGDPASK